MKRFLFISLILISYLSCQAEKIVGLMQVKNEEDIIEQALRGMAIYTDSIVVLDDGSTDTTRQIIFALSESLNIEKVILNDFSQWQEGTEFYNRQTLLDEGRKIGGTHFLELDADEILVATAQKDLREKILNLEKGQVLHIPLLNFWKGFEFYRSDFTDIFPDITYCSAIFCDDGASTLQANKKHSFCGFLHFGRFPSERSCQAKEKNVYEPSLDYAIMHLPYVNWRNVRIKQAWIMMLERIRLKDGLYNKSFFTIRIPKDVNDFYMTYQSLSDKNAHFAKPKSEWFAYDFFDKNIFLHRSVDKKLDDIKKWVNQYGLEYFSELSMIYDDLKLIIEGV